MEIGQQFLQNVLEYSTVDSGLDRRAATGDLSVGCVEPASEVT